MQVNKLRIASDGPVPAGRYFAKIAENLRAQNLCTHADAARAEAQERRLEARCGKLGATLPRPHGRHQQATPM